MRALFFLAAICTTTTVALAQTPPTVPAPAGPRRAPMQMPMPAPSASLAAPEDAVPIETMPTPATYTQPTSMPTTESDRRGPAETPRLQRFGRAAPPTTFASSPP